MAKLETCETGDRETSARLFRNTLHRDSNRTVSKGEKYASRYTVVGRVVNKHLKISLKNAGRDERHGALVLLVEARRDEVSVGGVAVSQLVPERFAQQTVDLDLPRADSSGPIWEHK